MRKRGAKILCKIFNLIPTLKNLRDGKPVQGNDGLPSLEEINELLSIHGISVNNETFRIPNKGLESIICKDEFHRNRKERRLEKAIKSLKHCPYFIKEEKNALVFESTAFFIGIFLLPYQ